jgi:hypothetical protein
MNAPGEALATDNEQLQWARRQFDLPSGAPPEEIRARILRHLEQVDFVPTSAESEAIDTLLGRRVEPACCLADRESGLEEQLDDFCAAFFTIPPPERSQRWQELVRDCAPFPRLHARLRPLERGLWVEQPVVSDESRPAAALARLLCDAFPRLPNHRAESRRRQLAEVEADPKRWENASRQLLRQSPEIADLDPDFVASIASWSSRRRRRVWKRRVVRIYDKSLVPALVVFGAMFVFYMGVTSSNHSRYSPPRPAFDERSREEITRQLLEDLRRLQESNDKNQGPNSPGEAFRRLFGVTRPKISKDQQESSTERPEVRSAESESPAIPVAAPHDEHPQ